MKWKLSLFRGLQGLGFPKIGGTILGVPIIRTIVFLGLYWSPFILGNYHIDYSSHYRFLAATELWLFWRGSLETLRDLETLDPKP